MAIEDDHPDILQNIEFAVAAQYKRHPEMTDYEALRTYEALVQAYSAEATGRVPKPHKLSGLEAELFDWIKEMCEWRLGRGTSPFTKAEPAEKGGWLSRLTGRKPEPAKTAADLPCDMIEVDVLVECLKRLLLSCKRWNKQNGQRGYLSFMTQYIR